MKLRPITRPGSSILLIAALWGLLALPATVADAGPEREVKSIEEIARQELERAMRSAPPTFAGPAEPGGGQEIAPGTRCLPSCAVDDGRFLAVASGASLVTLSETTLDIQIAVPEGVSSFQIGLFDGDADSANGNWDVGAAPFSYEVFSDPNRDGSSGVSVAGPFFSSALPNDAWFDITVPVSPSAQAPSGAYFYRISVASLDPALTVLNSFKLRTDGVASVEVRQQPFGFYAAIQSFDDALKVFPDFPDYDPGALPGELGFSNYDGEFNFYLDIEMAEDDVVVWGGDLDFGAYDGSTADTDDPDTPNACPDPLNPLACVDASLGPFLPSWATLDTVPEGVAVGSPGSTGNPADDVNPAGLGLYLQRSPSINFELIDPDGTVYSNPDPSGNQEWEQFRIATGPFDRNVADLPATSLPPGRWVVRARGVDMQNLNFWRFFYPVLCTEPDGSPCVPIRPYLVGDTVFFDHDGDGFQDAGDEGIGGVIVELLNPAGEVIDQTTTDGDGKYQFGASAGELGVRVSPLNFLPGGALEGLASTTGDLLTRTVVDDNVLTYDFGYRLPVTPECPPPLDFGSDAAGAPLAAGTIVAEQWAAYGIHITSNDPANRPPMIFDSANPTGGDWDLGAPNQDFGGPGVGAGGAAGTAGENSRPLGNVLIISEDGDTSDPDDNAGGGRLIFRFDQPVDIASIDILDVDVQSTGSVRAIDGAGRLIVSRSMMPVGDNGFQRIPLGVTGVRKLVVRFPGSGAVSGIEFCRRALAGGCVGTLDFETDGGGAPLVAGQVIDTELSGLGIQVLTGDPVGHPVMVFDSSNPSGGDSDLGTPNQDFGGPGVGSGGAAGAPGQNSESLSNLLIVSEDADSSDPDDDASGGVIIFLFDQPTEVRTVKVVDIDGDETLSRVTAFDSGGVQIATTLLVPLGNNSVQEVLIAVPDVSRLEVSFESSGALAEVASCPTGDDDDDDGGDDDVPPLKPSEPPATEDGEMGAGGRG